MTQAIVLGAGVNELVAAHSLARAGHRVLLIAERVTEESAGWISPEVVRELDLGRHGLRTYLPDPWITAPLPAGGHLELWRDMARSVEAIRALSPHDASKWPQFCARMALIAGFLESLYAAPPPDPLSPAFAIRARRLGKQGLVDLMRFLPMPVADLLDDWFESDVLKGILGSAALTDLQQGPRSAGTAYALLHHHVGSPAGVFRPARSNINQVLAGLPGIGIRPDVEVVRISVAAGRATGIVLADGEQIEGSLVISGAHARRTLLELGEPGWLDPELERAIRNIRCRGVAARVKLQLDRAPGFATLVIAPSLDYLERGYDDAKHGEMSRRPWIEARCEDSNKVEVRAQFVPYSLRDRTSGLAELVLAMLSPHLRGASVIEHSIAAPFDLEQLHGWPQGQPNQAELALDQALWMRPVPELAGYRTPIEGLFLCGTGTHPGGGVLGAAGRNSARVALRSR